MKLKKVSQTFIKIQLVLYFLAGNFNVVGQTNCITFRFPDIHFAKNSAVLSGGIKDTDLDFLYQLLINNPYLVIELDAHADDPGNFDNNIKLSQERGVTCKNYLISKRN